MFALFNTIIYEPIFNALLWIHQALPGHDMGLAIIVITLAVKILLYIPSLAAIKSSRQLQSLQPRMKELQEKYKNDKEGLSREQMKLYRESKVNPISSCLPLLIQIPLLLALYHVFLNGLKVTDAGILVPEQLQHLYSGLRDYYAHTPLNTTLFGWVNLANKHNVILAALAGLTQFWQTKMLAAPKEPKTDGAKDEAMASMMTKQMQYIFPFVTLYISYTLPAGLGLYWTVSTLFTIVQQYIFMRRHPLPTGTKLDSPAPQSGL